MSRRTAARLYDHAELLLTGEQCRGLSAVLARAGDDHMRLVEAVERLHRAAIWSPDRAVDGDKLWSDVRRAAGIAA